MTRKLGIDSRVKWLGQKDHDEVLRLYSIMDVVVVPSLFEGFGLTAAEAMACRRPVVASDVDGLSELIQSGANGLLVPPGNPQALANAIVEFLLNPSKATAMGVQGQKVIEEKFSMARYRLAMLTAYSRYAEDLFAT
jgi:glycosyltransferase involved in cell wall biosynthesis